MRAVLVASGDPHPADAAWLESADLVVAVDAGAAWLSSLGRLPDALVGDLDSIEPDLLRRLTANGVEVDRHPAEKDSSDCELALAFARRRGADEIVILGAIGGDRLDHELANVLLLAGANLPPDRLRIVQGGTCLRVLRSGDELTLDAPQGSLVSLLPIGGNAEGITTSGLRYPLRDERLGIGSTRGLSNEVASVPASVRLREGILLVIETEGVTT